MAIVNGDRIIHLRGFGAADPSGRPVTPQTPFIIGSLTKSFTALAIMQLVEADKLELDAPVQRYIPWFRLHDLPTSAQITPRHLLNHMSGISRYAGRQLLTGKGNATIEQRVRELRTVAVTKSVGSTFQYSNANYLILGLLIQIVSGQPYGSYIQQHIFNPLEMHHSFASQSNALQDGMATGYCWWFGMPFPAHLPYLSDALPAGFLLSSAEDMAHYLIAHLNGGWYGGTSILSPDGVAELHRSEAVIGSTDAHYGMGLVGESINGIAMLTHAGDTANFHADMILVSEGQWGIIVLTNANNALVGQVEAAGKLGTWRIATGVADLLIGRRPRTSRPGARTFYLALDTSITVLFVLQVRSLVRLLQGWRQPLPRQPIALARRIVLPLIYEVAVPLSVLNGLPKWTEASWSILRLYAPDLTFWSLIVLPFSLVTGALRAMQIFFKLRRPVKNDQNDGQRQVK